MATMRQLVGEVLRAHRAEQGLTLRALSGRARVSLGYISEIERGQKEPSSELLAALADALEVPLSSVLRDVADQMELHEVASQEVALAPLASVSSIAGDGVRASAA
ncbi:helix-turn-helix domain-containing protein [Aeromicrobium sp. Leaf350]|uniref:helix-turn-helix domain-containing protein n=1 Tax=Aeromicrobium sp. Leaf350 TaxID=2876565 RepID=UPI001E4C2363|nr:helix-turn-helix transcriptional regulator [Aeromicrobium sp. Leaf350]